MARDTVKTLPVVVAGIEVPGYIWSAIEDLRIGTRNLTTREIGLVCRQKLKGARLPGYLAAELEANPDAQATIDELFRVVKAEPPSANLILAVAAH